MENLKTIVPLGGSTWAKIGKLMNFMDIEIPRNVVENRSFFDVDKIRHMCIVRNLYTVGSSVDYATMMDFASNAEVTAENLVKIAEDIAIHSDLCSYGCTYRESVENFIYTLANDCVCRSFVVTW